MRIADLKPGWDVVANDGRRIGKIRDVGQHYLEVSGRGSVLYVPSSAIANVARDTVHLNLAAGEVEAMGWRQPPRSPDELRISPEQDADRDI